MNPADQAVASGQVNIWRNRQGGFQAAHLRVVGVTDVTDVTAYTAIPSAVLGVCSVRLCFAPLLQCQVGCNCISYLVSEGFQPVDDCAFV